MSLDVQLGQLDIQGIRVTVKLSRPQDLEVFTRPVADPLSDGEGVPDVGRSTIKEVSKFWLNFLPGPNYAISWFPLLQSLQRLRVKGDVVERVLEGPVDACLGLSKYI